MTNADKIRKIVNDSLNQELGFDELKPKYAPGDPKYYETRRLMRALERFICRVDMVTIGEDERLELRNELGLSLEAFCDKVINRKR